MALYKFFEDINNPNFSESIIIPNYVMEKITKNIKASNYNQN